MSGKRLIRFLPTRYTVLLVAFGNAVIWMLLILGIHRNSPRTLTSFHGFIHAAIAERFFTPTVIPPENPFYAGQPVSYYWFFQLLGAQISQLMDVNIFFGLEAVTIIATGFLMIMCILLGRLLFRNVLIGFCMGFLVVAGTNPFGFIFAALKIMIHGTQRLQENPSLLWNVVHPIYSLIRFNDFGGLYGPLINFFLNMTARPAALAALMISISGLYWSIHKRGIIPLAITALGFAMTTALSPIVGISAGGALIVGLVVIWLWDWKMKERGLPLENLRRNLHLTIIFAIVAGILLASPTYYHLITGPSDNYLRFSLLSTDGMRLMLTVTLSILPLFILAIIGFIKSRREVRHFSGILISAVIVLLLATVTFQLPSANQSNFFHASVIMLSVPASASILRFGKLSKEIASIDTRMMICVGLLFLPTFLLLLAAYINRPALPYSFADQIPSRLPIESDLAVLYRWVINETSSDAIFVLDPRERLAASGNIAEFPAMTGRVMFTENIQHYMVSPYADAKQRYEMAVKFVSGEELDEVEIAYLSALKRPIYLIVHAQDYQEIFTQLVKLNGPPVFNSGELYIFELFY